VGLEKDLSPRLLNDLVLPGRTAATETSNAPSARLSGRVAILSPAPAGTCGEATMLLMASAAVSVMVSMQSCPFREKIPAP
jgi:hypothetical protein